MAADDSDDDLVEEFWDRVADFESRDESSLFTLLPEAGVSLPPPDELGDAELTSSTLSRFGACTWRTPTT